MNVDAGQGHTVLANRAFPPQSNLNTLSKNAKATMNMGNLRLAVKLPPRIIQNEWIAVKTLDIFNEVGLLWSATSDFCTDQSCPVMSAGKKFEYLWADGEQYKEPVRFSAQRYTEQLIRWVDHKLNDTTLFPIDPQVPFPPNYLEVVSNILRRIFRVYAHIYHNHFQQIQAAGAEPHLNCCFKHFLFFVKEFNLVNDSDMEPMKSLINEIMSNYPAAEEAPAAQVQQPIA
eukprot:GDKI01035300.1.p2 GENE.GDKI01035300.1~~GDKI01035300.1.p2  ORF type:complete len:230 (+),score=75.45 GDKI01035300.1:76-765(+)